MKRIIKNIGCIFGMLSCICFAGCADSKSALILATESMQDEAGFAQESSADDTGIPEQGEPAGESLPGTQTEETGVYVYICGEVINPGVYILSEGARLCDAVEAAGGMTENASRTYWNLARLLDDGEMIYVPTMEEAAERDLTELYPQGENAEQGKSTDGISEDGNVNINTASEEQLMTIPGIGESKAKSIIDYREANGNFGTIEDIMNVSGIKDAMFQKIKDYITVD